MADAGECNLDANFVGARRGNLDGLDGEGLAGLPGHGGLARNGLAEISKLELAIVAAGAVPFRQST